MSINMKNLRFRHPVRYARMVARARRMAYNRHSNAPFAEERATHTARLRAERLEIQDAWAAANAKRAQEEEKGCLNFVLGLLTLIISDGNGRGFVQNGMRP